MKNPTYKQLKNWLASLTEDQLNTNVTIYDADNDEFYPVEGMFQTIETDVLDEDHPALYFNSPINPEVGENFKIVNLENE